MRATFEDEIIGGRPVGGCWGLVEIGFRTVLEASNVVCDLLWWFVTGFRSVSDTVSIGLYVVDRIINQPIVTGQLNQL